MLTLQWSISGNLTELWLALDTQQRNLDNVNPVYLDHNATTPIADEVCGTMQSYLAEHWYNPSSGHRWAKSVKAAIEESRAQVARFLGAESDEIVFTSGGTESINTALRMNARQGAKIITTAVEHSAAFETLQLLENDSGVEVVTVKVDENGSLNLSELESTIAQSGVHLLNVIWANNETGVIQPIDEIVRIAHESGVPVHVDAVQAAGKIQMQEHLSKVDFVSISAHKFNGPKGTGALRIRKNRRFSPLITGGGQEEGRRGGTENVPAIVGMGQAAELASGRFATNSVERITELRDRLEQELESLLDCKVNGKNAPRLSNTSSITFQGCRAEGLLLLLEDDGLICSTGSACSSGTLKPSRVLTAMGLSNAAAKSTLRFSLSHLTTAKDIQHALQTIPKAVDKLKSVQSPIAGPVVVYKPRG